MKVAIVTHETFFPVKGGGTIRVLKIAESFKRRGHNVKIFAPYGSQYDGENEVEGGINFYGVCNIERFKTKNKEFAYLKYILKTSVRLVFEDYDFLMAHIAVAGISSIPARIFKLSPSLIDLDDIISGLSSFGFIKKVAPKIERMIPHFYDSVSCMSEALAEKVRETGKKNVFVVPHGVDLKLFKPSNEEERELGHFVFSGGIEAHDGVDIILRAVALLKEKYPFIKLSVIGDGSKLSECINLCKELGLSDNVVFTGWIDHREIPKYHRKASAGIICDRYMPATEIALVVRGVEYMGSGLPIIASDNKGNLELVDDGENGLIFEKENIKALAQKMEWVINNPKGAFEMGMKGRKIAENKYDWGKNAEEIVKRCESIYSDYKNKF